MEGDRDADDVIKSKQGSDVAVLPDMDPAGWSGNGVIPQEIEDDDDEVFFGPVSDKEKSRAAKYSRRVTAVFNQDFRDKLGRHGRYTLDRRSVLPDVVEALQEEDEEDTSASQRKITQNNASEEKSVSCKDGRISNRHKVNTNRILKEQIDNSGNAAISTEVSQEDSTTADSSAMFPSKSSDVSNDGNQNGHLTKCQLKERSCASSEVHRVDTVPDQPRTDGQPSGMTSKGGNTDSGHHEKNLSGEEGCCGAMKRDETNQKISCVNTGGSVCARTQNSDQSCQRDSEESPNSESTDKKMSEPIDQPMTKYSIGHNEKNASTEKAEPQQIDTNTVVQKDDNIESCPVRRDTTPEKSENEPNLYCEEGAVDGLMTPTKELDMVDSGSLRHLRDTLHTITPRHSPLVARNRSIYVGSMGSDDVRLVSSSPSSAGSAFADVRPFVQHSPNVAHRISGTRRASHSSSRHVFALDSPLMGKPTVSAVLYDQQVPSCSPLGHRKSTSFSDSPCGSFGSPCILEAQREYSNPQSLQHAVHRRALALLTSLESSQDSMGLAGSGDFDTSLNQLVPEIDTSSDQFNLSVQQDESRSQEIANGQSVDSAKESNGVHEVSENDEFVKGFDKKSERPAADSEKDKPTRARVFSHRESSSAFQTYYKPPDSPHDRVAKAVNSSSAQDVTTGSSDIMSPTIRSTPKLAPVKVITPNLLDSPDLFDTSSNISVLSGYHSSKKEKISTNLTKMFLQTEEKQISTDISEPPKLITTPQLLATPTCQSEHANETAGSCDNSPAADWFIPPTPVTTKGGSVQSKSASKKEGLTSLLTDRSNHGTTVEASPVFRAPATRRRNLSAFAQVKSHETSRKKKPDLQKKAETECVKSVSLPASPSASLPRVRYRAQPDEEENIDPGKLMSNTVKVVNHKTGTPTIIRYKKNVKSAAESKSDLNQKVHPSPKQSVDRVSHTEKPKPAISKGKKTPQKGKSVSN